MLPARYDDDDDGSLWSRRIDSKVHKLDGSPHGVVFQLLEKRGQKDVCPARKILRKREFGGLSLPLICMRKSSGQNGTNAEQKYEVLSATILLLLVLLTVGLLV